MFSDLCIMNSKMTHPAKSFLATAVMLFVSMHAVAQRPVIKVVGKSNGSTAEVITLKGNTFGTDPTKLSVSFGAAKGTIKSLTDQLLDVQVPSGTTFDNITVTNTTSGLTSFSREEFLLSFGGAAGFSSSNLQGQTDFTSENGLYDLCMSDLDGDQRVDIVTANNKSNSISILKNASSGPGNINFAISTLIVGVHTLHVKCGDLNGDGKPDLVLSEDVGTTNANGRIFIFQNKSTGPGNFTFASPIALAFTASKPVRIEIADLDLDGKPEVIFTDQTINKVRVLANHSTTALISLTATPVDITFPEAATTDGLSVQDLNGDYLPELITSQFQTTTSNLFIAQNSSTPGNFQFTIVPKLSVGGSVKRIRVGDLDGDQKPDIAVTQLIGSAISVFLNKSSATSLSFSPGVSITTDAFPWGIEFGDIDGDGKTDIVVASVRSTNKSITILNNQSSPGNLSYTETIIPTTYINKHINIGDLDGDGKPDIAFTSVDDDNLGINSSKVSIFRNKACMIPVIDPAGPLTICSGFPLTLQSTVSNGTTYDWKQTGSSVKTGTDSFLDITASGDYTVTATAEGGSCSKVSNTVNITVNAAAAVGLVKPSNNGPVCIGSILKVFVTNDVGATYKWTGPAGYSSTGVNPTDITSLTLDNAGTYFVDVISGGCLARRESTLVEAITIPDFNVQFTGPAVTCTPPITLSVIPAPSTFTYQWFEKTTGAIGGAVSDTYNVTTTGEYSVKASFSGCGTTETSAVKITIATPPTPAFQLPAGGCMGQTLSFTDKSITDVSATSFYNWDFGDGKNSTDQNPTHKYTSASTFNVKLTVSYSGGACSVSAPSQGIVIQSAPVAAITNPDNQYSFCNGDKLKLEVLGSFLSYQWSTGETGSSILVDTAGTYKVQVTTSGCTLDADKAVQVSSPSVSITADPQQIDEGKPSQLTATGLDNYSWSPPESLSDPAIANPVAKPLVTTTYTVTGKDSTGCTGTATFEILVKGEPIVNKLKPSNFFSPDGKGDPKDDVWFVGSTTDGKTILDFPQCGVVIYDDKGIKVFEAKPYSGDWDGTFHGSKLPDGVYYYVIRCDGEQSKPKSGSITLLR